MKGAHHILGIKFKSFNPTEKVIDTTMVELDKIKLFVFILPTSWLKNLYKFLKIRIEFEYIYIYICIMYIYIHEEIAYEVISKNLQNENCNPIMGISFI